MKRNIHKHVISPFFFVKRVCYSPCLPPPQVTTPPAAACPPLDEPSRFCLNGLWGAMSGVKTREDSVWCLSSRARNPNVNNGSAVRLCGLTGHTSQDEGSRGESMGSCGGTAPGAAWDSPPPAQALLFAPPLGCDARSLRVNLTLECERTLLEAVHSACVSLTSARCSLYAHSDAHSE